MNKLQQYISSVAGAKPHVQAYGLQYVLIAGHFAPDPVATACVVISALCVFAYVCWADDLDIYSIFLFLLPAIGLHVEGQGQGGEVNWWFSSAFEMTRVMVLVGPLAVATPLAMAIAVPIRIGTRLRNIQQEKIGLLWIVALGLTAVGLYESVKSGLSSASGLSVGVRAVLGIGALMIWSNEASARRFGERFRMITTVSVVLFSVGILRNHWFFITIALLPYYLSYARHWIAWLPMACLALLIATKTIDLSFTMIFTFIASGIASVAVMSGSLRQIVRSRLTLVIVAMAPILTMYWVVSAPPRYETADGDMSLDYLRFKVFADRKPLWDASFYQIENSSALVVPAGRSLDVDGAITGAPGVWEWGSHNIALEIGRQVGLVAAIILLLMIGWHFIRTGHALRALDDWRVFAPLLAVYIVFGSTGNSLAHGGVGIFYWFICGQLYQRARRASPRPQNGGTGLPVRKRVLLQRPAIPPNPIPLNPR